MPNGWLPGAGGVAGPVAFVAAWALLGAQADGYDPTRDAISRLAALGAPTRPGMTAGLVALGAGMTLYGVALRPQRSWALPAVNGLTAFAVAALPLGGTHDTLHGAAAALGYVTLAAIPVVVGGRRPVAVAVSAASAALLLASVLVDRTGLCQRLGLTVAHVWVVVSALRLVRVELAASTHQSIG